MQNIVKRLGYYGIGVAMGIVFVYFLFGDRDIQCSYFPNSRVLKNLRSKPLQYTDVAACQRNCMQLDSVAIAHIFAAGSVDFSESNARKEPCGEYQITTRLPDQREIAAWVENCDSTVTILNLQEVEGKSCPCN